LVPVSRFAAEELIGAIKEMKLHLEYSPSMTSAAPTMDTFLDQCHNGCPRELIAPTLPARTLNLREFVRCWSQGSPVVVQGVVSQLQGEWGFSYFIQQYGSRKVKLVNCETQDERNATVADFFHDFGLPAERAGIWKLKVRLLFHMFEIRQQTILLRTGLRSKNSALSFLNYFMLSWTPFRIQILQDWMVC
jgi:hypothetical protein